MRGKRTAALLNMCYFAARSPLGRNPGGVLGHGLTDLMQYFKDSFCYSQGMTALVDRGHQETLSGH